MTTPVSFDDPGVRRLVNAVLVPGFVGTRVPRWLADELAAGLGGVCWFTHNVPDRDTARLLADEIHALGDHPLVWCDEEGGAVSRLDEAAGSPWPGHAALGQLDDPQATRTVAAGIGAHAREAGVDVVLAPVVDVNSDPLNPVIGVRSFGDTAELVARHGSAFVDGLQSQGVAGCAKHFPGHGATQVDSHLDLPVIDIDPELLWARELAPFAAAIDTGVRCVLTAHVVFPSIDDRPATMSSPLLTMLRERLEFDGVIITDALDMRAISAGVGRGEGAVTALEAGADALCIGNPMHPDPYDDATVFADVRRAIGDALETGRLDIERVAEAAGRLTELGEWTARTRGGQEPHRAPQGLEIARRTLRVDGDVALRGAPLILIHQSDNIAAGDTRSVLVRLLGEAMPQTVHQTVTSAREAAAALDMYPGMEAVVLTDGLGGTEVVDTVRASSPDAVVVHTGPAGVGSELAAPLVRTWGGGAASARAVLELFLGS